MKTAIVTGGTSGIGLAIVKMLAAKGYRVLATYSSNDMEEEIANVETCRADQSDKESMRAFVAWVKQTAERVDCIVLNAGITLRKGLTDFSDEEWERQDNILKTITKQPLFEGIRKCEICGCEKPISEFSKSYKHRCKACQAEVMRNKRKEIKK